MVTYILFGAENDAATRFCLTALLSALQKMCEKRARPTTPSIISFTNFDNNKYYFFDQRISFSAKPHELFSRHAPLSYQHELLGEQIQQKARLNIHTLRNHHNQWQCGMLRPLATKVYSNEFIIFTALHAQVSCFI